MKVGLLLNSNGKLCTYSDKYEKILKNNNIPFILIDPNSPNFLDELKNCSHLLFRHSQGDTDKILYGDIYNIINNVLKIKCSPNFQTFWPYENKVREYYLLKSHNFPIIESYIFWNYDEAKSFLKKTNFPLVVKLPKGAGSNNVVLINSNEEGIKIIKQVFYEGIKSSGINHKSNLNSFSKLGIINYFKQKLKGNLIKYRLLKPTEYPEWQIQKDVILFQKFLPNNFFDTRVTIIGNKAFAYRRFVRNQDFRASGSGNFDPDPRKIDPRCIKIAFEISNKLNFTTMAYDFIVDKSNTPFINEISYCFVDSMVYSCPGFWDENIIWNQIQKWPQYYQLSDFLNLNLKSDYSD